MLLADAAAAAALSAAAAVGGGGASPAALMDISLSFFSSSLLFRQAAFGFKFRSTKISNETCSCK